MSNLSKKHHIKAFLFLIAFVVVFFVARNSLADFTSLNFEIENPSTAVAGGGESSSSNFQYISSTSQIDQGESTSLNFLQRAGFLYFPSVSATSTTGTTTTGTSSGGHYPRVSEEERRRIIRVADFNRDGYVDLVDMSILLYYYGHTGPEIIPYDLSNDGVIDIIDASILLYYWEMTSYVDLG
jgi:hypothetical protein